MHLDAVMEFAAASAQCRLVLGARSSCGSRAIFSWRPSGHVDMKRKGEGDELRRRRQCISSRLVTSLQKAGALSARPSTVVQEENRQTFSLSAVTNDLILHIYIYSKYKFAKGPMYAQIANTYSMR